MKNTTTSKDEEVLPEVKYVGICDSDLPGLEHKCSEIIKKVGKNVTNFKVGQHVCIEPDVPCYKCEFFLSGYHKVCPNVDLMATQPNYCGTLSNYLTYPEAMTFHLPENMSLIEGNLVEPATVDIIQQKYPAIS